MLGRHDGSQQMETTVLLVDGAIYERTPEYQHPEAITQRYVVL